MGVSAIAEKLNKYQKRLSKGKADKIKPEHIEKAIEKLVVKKEELTAELQDVTKPEKRERIEKKLSTIQKQIERAKWLEQQVC